MRKLLFILIALLAAAVPAVALAQGTTTQTNGVLVRVDGDVHVAAGDTTDVLVVVHGNAVVDGSVRQTMWIVDGTATVTGTANGDIVAVNSTVDLKQPAIVRNITLVKSTLNRDDGAQVTGALNQRSQL